MRSFYYSRYFILSLILLLTGCSVSSSNGDSKINITLSSSILTKNDTILVELHNQSDDLILISGDTMSSQLQKKSKSGNWVTLTKWNPNNPPTSASYFEELKAREIFGYEITHDLISNYTDDLEGEYRAAFKLFYNHDYENFELLVSEEFVVQ